MRVSCDDRVVPEGSRIELTRLDLRFRSQPLQGGRASFSDLPRGRFGVVVRDLPEGWLAPDDLTVRAVPGERAEVVVALERTSRAVGVVRVPPSVAAGGLLVRLHGKRSGIARTILTNAGGSFACDALRADRYVCRVAAPGGHPLAGCGESPPVEFDLAPGESRELELALGTGRGRIEGRVVDRAGRPVPGTWVVVIASGTGVEGGGPDRPERSVVARVATDETGHFVAENLPEVVASVWPAAECRLATGLAGPGPLLFSSRPGPVQVDLSGGRAREPLRIEVAAVSGACTFVVKSNGTSQGPLSVRFEDSGAGDFLVWPPVDGRFVFTLLEEAGSARVNRIGSAERVLVPRAGARFTVDL